MLEKNIKTAQETINTDNLLNLEALQQSYPKEINLNIQPAQQ